MCANSYLPNTACNLIYHDDMNVRNVLLKEMTLRDAVQWYDLCDGRIIGPDNNWYDLEIEIIENENGIKLIEE